MGDAMTKITVVTVCYNGGKTIKRTIESVLEQSYRPLEYVIIDGGSTDDTMLIVNSYASEFERKEITYKSISEPDNGVFDAMNKAVKISTGEYIVFINADDLLVRDSITALIDKVGLDDFCKYDILYGNHYLLIEDQYIKKIVPGELRSITKTMPFSHQAVFTKRSLLTDNPFNTKYTLCADYDFYLEMYLKNKKFHYIDSYVSYFSAGGLCQTSVWKTRRQVFAVREEKGIINKRNYLYNLFHMYLYILKVKIFHSEERNIRKGCYKISDNNQMMHGECQ